uniref:Alpha-2-HS-glycoprotein n=1 Tax=Paramormyrops kingsleyae TaxID=1676925 RepID=A0A3B3SNL5_9TELE
MREAMLTLAGLFLLAHVFLAAGVLPAERPSIPCDENGAVPASQAAFQHISAQHHHGYKYKPSDFPSSQDDLACEFHLELDLEETTCHVVNPKPVEECVVRETHETKVQSNCNVTLTVVEGKPTVKKYSCSSDPASAEELQKICPDCPSLLPLHYPAGLDSIKSALKKFHEESNETSNFKLLEVGRLSTQHMLTGQSYLAEFAIVQTDCRSHVICVLGRGKAQYGFCKSTVLGNDEVSVDCEIYDAQVRTLHHCRGQVKIPPSIHPICPHPIRHMPPTPADN